MSWVLRASDDLAQFAEVGGGKAKHLARLSQLGHEVPPFFCLTADCFRAFVAENALSPVLQSKADFAERAEAIERAFVAVPIPREIDDRLAAALKDLVADDGFVAVRSSGLDEDSAEHSFAGQFSSYLFQRGLDQVRLALRRCWASGFSERALSYRRERGLSLTDLAVGVVVQRMVDAESAGVAFSRNPIKLLDRDSAIVSSVFGLGEGLVSGELDADHFEVDRESLAIRSTIVDKPHALVSAAGGGLERRDIPADRRSSPSLTDAQVGAIAKTAIDIERAFGAPQDIEWAVADGRIYILQARPITTLPRDALFDARVVGDEPILWDNSNIIESYCGVTSALTFSFVTRAYAQVYEQFATVMGAPPDVVAAHRPVFRNMLGLVRGRVYYNIINWYRLLTLFPGAAETAKSQMETMMGVKQGITSELQTLFERELDPPKYSLAKKLSVVAVTVGRFVRIRSIIDAFVTDFTTEYERLRKLDLSAMSLTELVRHVHHVENRFLSRWQAPIINDTRCMVFFGTLKQLTEKWIGRDSGTLQNDLLCGQGDLDSTEPTKMLMRIADQIDNGDPELRAWFVSTSSKEVWQELSSGKRSKTVQAAFAQFLDRYGFRCVNELKLEEPDLHDDPSFAVEAVASYVRSHSYSIEAMERREAEIRDKAQEKARASLTGLRRLAYFWTLRHARSAVRDRENLRFLRTKVFGLLRHGYQAIGHKLAELGELDSPRDVFHLTTDEILGFAEGRAVSLDLAGIARVRRAEYDRYRKTPAPPDRFITRGAAGASMRHAAILLESDLLRGVGVSDDPNLLLGTSCCPGVVEGTVRVVHSIADAQGIQGEILATERTDPGWVPLFPSCSGLLIERGSLLSHSAVVARELGLPTIVGISGGLMTKLKTGMRVRMDAGKGEVRILE